MMNYSFNFSFTPGKVMLKESYIKQMREIAPDEHSLTMTAVCGFIALLSFVGNLLLCVVILKRRSMLAKPYNVLIFNLAVTDMLTGVFIAATPNYVFGRVNFSVHNNLAGELFCRLIGSTYFLFLFGKGSTLTVMCLAIERWFSVIKPLKYKYAFKRGRLLLYIAVIWAFSCFTQINELFIMKPSHGVCEKNRPPYSKKTEKVLILLHILATFFVPSIVTWVTFAHVWLHVRRAIHHRRRLSNYERAKQKLIRMCALTAFLLTVCWFPAEMFFILREFNAVSLPFGFYQFTDMLAMSNSCFNPWVYYLYNKEYRKAFLSLVTVKMKRQNNTTNTFSPGMSVIKSPSVVLTRQVNPQSECKIRELDTCGIGELNVIQEH